jgi:hypothetical protein
MTTDIFYSLVKLPALLELDVRFGKLDPSDNDLGESNKTGNYTENTTHGCTQEDENPTKSNPEIFYVGRSRLKLREIHATHISSDPSLFV